MADSKDRAKDLKALAEKEDIRHTALALVVAEDNPALAAGWGKRGRRCC